MQSHETAEVSRLRLDKKKLFGKTFPFHLECQWKSPASDCSPFSNFQWLSGLLWFWHDHVGSSEKNQTFPHTWGRDIPVSLCALACLHAVFVILPPVSPALHNVSSFEQYTQLGKGEIPVPCIFPSSILVAQIAVLGCKAKRHFYHC